MSPRRQRRRPRSNIREEVWNLPNILTYGRIAAIPFLMYLLYQCEVGADPQAEDMSSRLYGFWATIVFSLAAITDFLDGWVARNWNLGSTLGRFLDPLADKLIVMACLVMMVELDRVPAWFVVLLITRELSITSLRSIAGSEGIEVRVSQGGKWKTAFQLCGLIGVLVHYEYEVSWGILTMDFDFGKLGFALLVLSMVLSLMSAAQYFRSFAVAAAATREPAGSD
ncbi:MAG: CDP-diacylglycerol--glycerol-3-phosphate 3-phosphatidyltransferase [Myxococcota bacterium]|jgi:CDP-diacylglycerol--glycerol-3-phosphate 3-phosphatidyltransferase